MDTPKVRTGLGKSDCPGSQGGCRKRGLFKEVRAPAFYPDRRTRDLCDTALGAYDAEQTNRVSS